MRIKKKKNFKIYSFTFIVIMLFGAWVNSTTFFRSKLSDYYLKEGRPDKALSIYEKIIRKEEFLNKNKSTSLPLKNLDFNKRLFNIYFKLSKIYKNINKWYDVALQFEKLIKLYPDISINAKSVPEICALSLIYAYNNDYENAINLLDRIKVLTEDDLINCDSVFMGGIWKNIEDPYPHFAKGRLFLLQERYSEALWEYTFALLTCDYDKLLYFEKDLDLALKKIPNDSGVYYKLGLAYKRLGEQTKAISTFERAISIDKGHLPSYYQLKELYKKKDNLDKVDEIDVNIKSIYSNMKTAKITLENQEEIILPVLKIYEAEDYIYNDNALKIDDPHAFSEIAIQSKNKEERSLLFHTIEKELAPGMYRIFFRIKTIENANKDIPLGIIDIIYSKFYKTFYTGKRFHQARKVIYASDFKETGQYQDFYLDFFNPGVEGSLNFRFFSDNACDKIFLDRAVLTYNPVPIDKFHIEVIKAYRDLYIMTLG